MLRCFPGDGRIVARPLLRQERMARSSLGTSLLKSRFGRRLFGLFAICSLLPTAVLALISFGTVTGQLRESSIVRITHTGDQVARGIVERLRLLNDDLRRVRGRLTPCPPAATWQDGTACDEGFIYWLSALTFVPIEGPAVPMFGPPVAELPLQHPNGPAADRDLGWVVSGIDANGNPIIVSGNHNRTVAESVYPRSRISAYVMPGG